VSEAVLEVRIALQKVLHKGAYRSFSMVVISVERDSFAQMSYSFAVGPWNQPYLRSFLNLWRHIVSVHRFKQIHLEITTLCNLSCAFCPKTTRTPPHITADQFRSRVETIAPFTDLIYLHLMGEPLSHPELPSFLAIAEELAAPIGITTNGTLIHRHIETLASPAIRQLNISFHAFTDPHKTVLAADAVKLIAAAHPNLYINIRLWMTHETADLSDDPVVNVMLSSLNISPELLDQHAFGNRASRNVFGNVYVHFDRPFDWPGNAPVDTCGTCHGLHTQIGILTDGSVVPCCLDNEGQIVLGNIDEESLEQIVGSPRARTMRGGFTRGEMIESLCQKCGYAQDRFGQKKQVVRRRESLKV